jgi:hypothetical protein
MGRLLFQDVFVGPPKWFRGRGGYRSAHIDVTPGPWRASPIDVHPDELKDCLCKIAFLYVHPNEYRPDGSRTAREAWVRVPGKHRNKDAAWDALENMIA